MGSEMCIRDRIYGNKVFADTDPADIVVADYTFRANEQDWPSYFTIAVEYSLSVVFATSIARDATLAALMKEQARESMAKARSLDSQQQTSRKLTTSRFIAERRS